ncbi:thioesterase family protein [uncultured Umboniibacter sp.]|uniref:acyl-CoA thioesterase n=1 Tax=uncultured Umboniibacter sp. TaxID=1798917 RepID=UPI00260E7530|nr:thioesterase family protein [uncultured Umboniibacter sp.]
MAKAPIPTRSDYHYFAPISTRWMDNDMFGHVNNVTYYSYFDTVANGYLIERGGFQPTLSPVIGYIVSSSCAYHRSIAFPDAIEGGFRVNRLGNSSVEYGVAIFKQGEDEACAHGTMTHVFVDRETEKPQPIEGQMREALLAALV